MNAAFDRQLETLVSKGYPALVGLDESEFASSLEPLRRGFDERSGTLVIRGRVPPEQAIGLVELDGRPGFTTMDADDLGRFMPTDSVELPGGWAYTIVDADPGHDLVNVTPEQALPTIIARGRSPLTIDEAIAVVTQHPQVLERDRFSVLGSRCGDRRVPAIWVSERRPRLGWCYADAPHTWLGSASSAGRSAQGSNEAPGASA
jgi:Family of unknown function (DUF5701)